MDLAFSMNMLSNYGKTGYGDTVRVERGDGSMVLPTYGNTEFLSVGMVWATEYAFFACAFPNYQGQAYAGLHWGRHAALGYFPTVTLSGRHLLHGIQLDLNGFDRASLSASLYQENAPSILGNPAFGEPGPVKTFVIGSVFLNLPWKVGAATVWMSPNYRRALDHPSLARYGMNMAFAFSVEPAEKPPGRDVPPPKESKHRPRFD